MESKLHEAITESPLFKHLEEDWVGRILDQTEERDYEESEIIIHEGRPVSHLFIVLEGRVRVSTESDGREVELKNLGPGAYFGEVSLLSGKDATATVEAKSDAVELAAIEREVVVELVKSDERIRKMLEGVTLARAKDTIGKVLE